MTSLLHLLPNFAAAVVASLTAGALKKHVLLACMPKSASTFLSQAISELPSMKKVNLHAEGARTEQILSVSKMEKHKKKNYVAQVHVCYGDGTLRKIEKYGLAPVVLTRDLFDCAASFRDHIRNESHIFPMAWMDQSHIGLSDEKLENAIADMIMPWYVKFYTSWAHHKDAHWVRYEDVRADPARVMRGICSFAKIEANDADIKLAVSKAQGRQKRFNKGLSGRGSEISEYAKDRIRTLTTHYPDYDFTSVLDVDQPLDQSFANG